MELESSYNLLGVMRDDGIRTYRAIEIASGQELQVHLFAKPDSEPDRALFRALRSLPVSKRRELLEIGTEGDMPYIVTEKLPEDLTARAWLTKLAGLEAKPPDVVFLAGSWKTGTPIPEEVIRASHSSAPPVPPAPQKPAELSADYTRVMRVPQPVSGLKPAVEPEIPVSRPSEVSQKPHSVLPPEPPPAVEPPPEEEDEFARMFGTAPPSKPPVLFDQPPTVAPVTPHDEPGEFTRTFLAGKAPEPAPAMVPSPSPAGASQAGRPLEPAPPAIPVTPGNPPREFASQSVAASPPEPMQTVFPPQPQPSEFTGLFLAAQPPAPKSPMILPQPATPPQPPPGEFTGMFLASKPPETAPPAVPPQPAPSNVANQQPGEFTSIFLAAQPPVTAAPLTAGTPPGDITSMFLAAQPSQPTAVTPQGGPPTDDATRPFQAIQASPPPPRLQADAPPVVQPPPVPPSSEEATRLFQAIAPSTPPPNLTPQPRGGNQPGEFARMFPSVEPSGSPTGPGKGPEVPHKEGPSEFTRFFQSPMYPTPAGNQKMASSTPGQAPTPASRPSAQPGEFTQLFGNPNKPAASPAPPPPLLSSSSPSSATGVFKTPSVRPQSKASGITGSSPGEFTRMMKSSMPPTLGQPSAEPPEPKPKSNVLLFVAGGAVLLAIILIIVFFLMYH